MSDTTRLAHEQAMAAAYGVDCLMGMSDPAWCGNCRCGAREPLPDVPLIDAPEIVDGRPIPARLDGRCRCRASCLSPIDPGDPIVKTTAGWVLADHSDGLSTAGPTTSAGEPA